MDVVFNTWLGRQHEEGMALSADSPVLTLHVDADRLPPQRYLARFDCPTLVRDDGRIERVDRFDVLIQFPSEYLRTAADPSRIIALLAPRNAFHPNVAPPFICTGRIHPGTPLCELVYQVHEILTFRKMTPREDDALNHEACVWARSNMERFPLDTRPLRRRMATFTVNEIGAGAEA